MAREKRKRQRQSVVPGRSPGTVVVDPEAPKPRIRLMAYGPDALVEEEIDHVADISRFLAQHPVTWVNVDGLGDAQTIQDLGQLFGLHPLALEDVVNVTQRPKVEEYGQQLFIVVRMPIADRSDETEQLSLFLGKDFVLTFQEREGDCLEPVRLRARRGRPRLRNSQSDYLAYALLDAVVDSYFPLLDRDGEQLTALENEILTFAEGSVPSRLHDLKGTLAPRRRLMSSFREMFAELLREDTPLIADATRVYLRDCYDHTLQLIDLLDMYRDTSAGLMDLYLSSLSNRMNEVMKVLTITATIFIPLTFIAGIYGMNFDPDRSPLNMPELGWYWGYPFAMTLMGIVAVVMVFLFRRKGWLGSRGRKPPGKPPPPE
ncbi:MAG: magnesium/cobalt transporter CorA [Candidatus Latescibacterota bacterium]|nr:MAG: magnesium/cobalt transporter CorA [Candidatus Latescibacterota bacterium]